MWFIQEFPNDGDDFHILRPNKNNKLELIYVARDLESAETLISALKWYETLEEGVFCAPPTRTGPMTKKPVQRPSKRPTARQK